MSGWDPNTHWRDSARVPRLFVFDYRATFPFLALLFRPSWWVFTFALLSTLFFWGLERWGFSLAVFGRWLRNLLAGPHRSAFPWWMRHR